MTKRNSSECFQFPQRSTKQCRNKLLTHAQSKAKANFIRVRNNKFNQFLFHRTNTSDFFLSNGYTVLWFILYMCFLTLLKKPTLTCQRRTCPRLDLFCNSRRKQSGFRDNIYHGKCTHQLKHIVQRAASMLKCSLMDVANSVFKIFFSNQKLQKISS